mgnify:CR=1 FL=1
MARCTRENIVIWYTIVFISMVVAGGAFNSSRVDAFVESNHRYLNNIEKEIK